MTLAIDALLITTLAITGIPTTTITGPITATPPISGPIMMSPWNPGESEYTLEPTLPNFMDNMELLIGIALTWIQETWLESSILDYWMLYQVAVFLFGRFLGNILGRGGFSVKDRVETWSSTTQHKTEEK